MVQCIQALHSRVFLPYCFHTVVNERTDGHSFLSRARVVRFKCRSLEAKLAASRTGPGRVLWMSSFAAHAHTFDADDWQLVNSTMPYEASKFQMDLIRAELSRRAGPPLRGAPRCGGLVHIRGTRQRPFDLCQDFHVLSRAFHSFLFFSNPFRCAYGTVPYVAPLQVKDLLCVIHSLLVAPNVYPSRVSTEVGEFSYRLGGSAICTTTSLRGMVPQPPFTSASLHLRLFRSCCLPLGCPLYQGRSRKRVRSLYACIL
jgi:hypothetical protein